MLQACQVLGHERGQKKEKGRLARIINAGSWDFGGDSLNVRDQNMGRDPVTHGGNDDNQNYGSNDSNGPATPSTHPPDMSFYQQPGQSAAPVRPSMAFFPQPAQSAASV